MNILAIDTSCDETSVAIVRDDWIISNKLLSQIEVHKKWGGVVPGIARTMHQENLPHVISDALLGARMSLDDIDVFAVTYGPGLAIALEVGIGTASSLSVQYAKPLVAVNHMEGHIYSALAKNSRGKGVEEYTFPLLCLLVSGGHTELVLMKDHGSYEIVGRTLDDAVGEAFDKVARMLELGYPGGPILEKLASAGNPKRFVLPVPMRLTHSADFSFSGLKTAAMNLIEREIAPLRATLSADEYRQVICDVAATFQQVAIEALSIKMKFALRTLAVDYEIKDIIIAGGVSANTYLRNVFRGRYGHEFRIHFPIDKKMYGDNAGMIGVAAYFNALRENFVDSEGLERDPILSL